MLNLHVDFETACDLNLTAVGLHRTIEHPSFKVLCVAYKVDASTPVVIRLDRDNGLASPPAEASQKPKQLPPALQALLLDPGVQGHAWNAAFEDRIIRAFYGIVPARPLSCTMQRAYAYGLPGKLERAGLALGTQWQKDMAGHRVMMKMAKTPGAVWSHEDWAMLLTYCMLDVEAEAEIAGMIPELTEAERQLSGIDACMNNEGVWVDTGTVRLLARVADDAEKAEAARAAELSAGAVTSPGTQTARLVAWLRTQGMAVEDVKRATMEEHSAGSAEALDGPAAEMLGIRLRTARASTKKLKGILERVSSGDRLRGQFQFLGASRTGRWAGRGVQLQNLPRIPKGFDPLGFVKLASASTASNDLDAVSPAPVLDCVSWAIRSCFGSEDGTLWSFDFSQIEARVLAWLAGQSDVLDVFRSGEDIYTWAAKQFHSDNRQLGKVLILALGFGMGAVKLRNTAKANYGVTMSDEEAQRFHTLWRRQNRKIVAFWSEIEAAARAAILQRGKVFPVLPSAITLQASAKTLQMRLPSGRTLYYHQPYLSTTRGEIRYWGEEQGQWVERKTWGGTLAENATQATARDIMAEAMSRVAVRLGVAPLMTVHDELVYASGSHNGSLEKLVKEVPEWAGGLPLEGEAKVYSRYGVLQSSDS